MPIKVKTLRGGDELLAVGGRPTERGIELYLKGEADMELAKLVEANHTVSVKLRVPGDDGATVTEEVKVVYRPIDAAVLKELDAIEQDIERGVVDQAALLVKGLPDVTTNGVPVEINLELFKQMDARHPTDIVTAILAHFRGKG